MRKKTAPPVPPVATTPTPTITPAATFEPIGSLVPWSKNPRRNEAAVERVAESIRQFGFAAPIIARLADRMVIAGHTRLLAAKRLGLTEVPVRFVDLGEGDAKRLALADNKLGEIAEWDDAALSDVLASLVGDGGGVTGLGFSDDEIAGLLGDGLLTSEPSDKPSADADEDEVAIGGEDDEQSDFLIRDADGGLLPPFPYFGGKRSVVTDVWARLGKPKQYIEPFCGSAVMLLASPGPASLEVVGDANGFIANFWRAVKNQPGEVARWADYPVSHIDLGARHQWLMDQRARLATELLDANWPGDAKVAGWWLWGQCAWIGSGWCEWEKKTGQIPHVGDAGQGIQATGKVPHVGDAGRGIQATGKVPHASDAEPAAESPDAPPDDILTTCGQTAWRWLHQLAARLERVRVVHGDWSRMLNHHYGGTDTAVFLDPPYRAYEKLYGVTASVASAVEAWAKAHPELRIALCGHYGDYDLPGWKVVRWSRGKMTYGGNKTTAQEAIYYSPACLEPPKPQPK